MNSNLLIVILVFIKLLRFVYARDLQEDCQGQECCTEGQTWIEDYEECVDCPYKCKVCEISYFFSTCIECFPGYVLPSQTDYGECVEEGSQLSCGQYQVLNETTSTCECVEGYYMQGNLECAACATGCGQCDHSNQFSCTECQSDYVFHHPSETQKYCGTDPCEDNYQKEGEECYPCHSQQVYNSATSTCDCVEGFYKLTPPNYDCAACADGCGQCADSNQYSCNSCSVGFVFHHDSSTEKYCGANTCDGGYQKEGGDDCYPCRELQIYNETTGLCDCPVGTYKDENYLCQNCADGCDQCTSSNKYDCDLCAENNVYHHESSALKYCSISQCDSDYQTEGGEDCYPCRTSQTYNAVTFTCDCPVGNYKKEDYECEACAGGCAQCINNDQYNCNECSPGYVYHHPSATQQYCGLS